MISTYNHRFLLVTHLRGMTFQPEQLRERLNSILDRQLDSRCQLLFCDEGHTEMGWLIPSDWDYRTLTACLCRLAQPDCSALQALGLRLERFELFELFEQYETQGLGAAWRWCRNVLGRIRLRLLM
ncbi:hypothetical protein PUP75_14715 [Pseudomonas chlororaphis]|uniref:hypothetical protein n=1 Tax=Pseudomonas chlororaphis TaxID=587753 RepID=UPI0023689C66|nr:hypothetical protein [Pseudomonas chlororaphis]WDH55994.1 hypothetical protein PUP75_14715 [Pseudomonas chlororaphis]